MLLGVILLLRVKVVPTEDTRIWNMDWIWNMVVHYESIDSYLSIPYFEVHVRVLYIHFMFNGYRQFQIGTAKIDAQYYFYSLKSSCCIGDLLNEMIIRNTNTNSTNTLDF